MIFDPRESHLRVRQNIAPGPPAGFAEASEAAWSDAVKNSQSMSAQMLLHNAYEDYLSDVEQTTGRRLFNPMERFQPGVPSPVSGAPRSLESHEQELFDEVSKLAEKTPGLTPLSPKAIRDRVADVRRSAREQRALVSERTVGFGPSAGEFFGEAAALTTDPPVLGSMLVGAPWATSVLRAALIEGGIAAGVEVPVQAAVQAQRPQFGEEVDVGEAAANVAMAGAGGALFGGGIRALVRAAEGATRLSGRARDALNFLQRKVEIEDETPYVETPAGRAAHAERFDEALVNVRQGRVAEQAEAAVPVRERASAEPQRIVADAFRDDTFVGDIGAEAARVAREVVERAADETSLSPADRIVRDRAAAAEAVPTEPEAARVGKERKTNVARETEVQPPVESLGVAASPNYRVRAPAGTHARDEGFSIVRETIDGSGRTQREVGETGLTRQNALTRARELVAGDMRALVDNARQQARPANRAAPDQREGRVADEQAEPASLSRGARNSINEASRDTARLERTPEGADNAEQALETTLRTEFAERMDERVWVEGPDGSPREVTVREIFDDLDDDETLVREALDCAFGGGT